MTFHCVLLKKLHSKDKETIDRLSYTVTNAGDFTAPLQELEQHYAVSLSVL